MLSICVACSCIHSSATHRNAGHRKDCASDERTPSVNLLIPSPVPNNVCCTLAITGATFVLLGVFIFIFIHQYCMVEIINNLNKSNPTPSLSLAPELTDELSLLEASLGGGGNHSGPQPLAQKLFNVFKNFGNLFSSLVTLLNNYYSLITLYFTCTGWAKKVIYCV